MQGYTSIATELITAGSQKTAEKLASDVTKILSSDALSLNNGDKYQTIVKSTTPFPVHQLLFKDLSRLKETLFGSHLNTK